MPNLLRFFRPRTIAIFGASEDFRKINGRPLKFLLDKGYEGAIYPINPKHQSLAGLPCYADVRAIPGPVDLAIVALPAEAVYGALEACIEKDVGGAVIFSSGFSEMDERGKEREKALAALARRSGMPICGPNTVGFWNAYERVLATFSQAGEGPVAGGPVAFVTQSGAFGTAIVALLRERGLSLGYFVNSGNEADLTFADLLEYVVRDDRVRVIAGYIEGLTDGPKLLAVADEALALGKPLVIAKVGRSAAGAKAALSHTGSLAGSDRVYSGVFRQKGIVRVEDEEELLDFVAAFTMCPLPHGPRIALVTHSGGAGVLMADRAESEGLETASLSPATKAALRNVVPSFGSIENPIDITAQFIAEPHVLRETLEIVFADPNVDLGVFYLGLMDAFSDTLIEQFRAVLAGTKKPLLIAWAAAPGAARAKMSELGICAFPTATRAVSAAGALVRYARRRKSARPADPSALPAARSHVAKTCARPFELLQEYGIAVAPWRVVSNTSDAIEAARAIGYPVAIKVESPGIQHKSDAHAVVLGVLDDAGVRSAYESVVAAARGYDERARIDGVLVQKMIEGGEEVIIGVHRDPVFGPVVMVGLGGIFVEVLADVSFRAAPLTLVDAHEMLRELRGFAVLSGLRGRPAANVDALAEALVNISRLATERADTVLQFDLNPVKALPNGVVVVDALLIAPDKKPVLSIPGHGSDRGIEAWVFIDSNPTVTGSGPLSGLTCGIKDIIDVAGMPTRFGVDFHERHPNADAPCVAALREAGAAILGKTQTTAFAYLDPSPTRNPHDPERTPGGSSAGSAAAVAAGHVDFALGTQTVGSVLRPASFCGVVGFKPSYGYISTRGVSPLAPSLDHVGILARSAAIASIVARVLIPTLASPGAPARPRIAVDRELFSECYGDEARTALARFERRLARQADVVSRDFGAVARATLAPLATILAFEAAAALPFLRGRDRPPEICALVRRGTEIDETIYRNALAQREALRLEVAPLFDGVDALLTLCAGPAPTRETTGDARSLAPWSFFGMPSLTLPVSRSSGGLPIGIQLVAPEGADARLLALAERFEAL